MENSTQEPSKQDIERQIKGYVGLKNLARNMSQKETEIKFDRLITDLKNKLKECH